MSTVQCAIYETLHRCCIVSCLNCAMCSIVVIHLCDFSGPISPAHLLELEQLYHTAFNIVLILVSPW